MTSYNAQIQKHSTQAQEIWFGSFVTRSTLFPLRDTTMPRTGSGMMLAEAVRPVSAMGRSARRYSAIFRP